MKITGGQAQGLHIDTPPGNKTRPSTDRLRESLFAILTPVLKGSRVLDLYSGSGSLGLEAASRGASVVRCVEQHGSTVAVLEKNIRKLSPAGVVCKMDTVRQEVLRFLKRSGRDEFDLIFADPPYADLEKQDAFLNLITAIDTGKWLNPSGCFVLESSSRWEVPEIEGWRVSRRKTYGHSAISIWQRCD